MNNHRKRVGCNFLGNTGMRVSNICLGTLTFGVYEGSRPGQCDEKAAHEILDRFVELGGNFIDTSNNYARGQSESIVGTWLAKQRREDIVLATKVRFGSSGTGLNSSGLSRGAIMTAVDQSLQRLGTEYIDLYQIHAMDYATPIEETLCALNDLVRMGKVRYLGGSNLSGWQLQKIVDLCKHNNWAPFITLQNQYNLLCRESEFELTEVCGNEGVGFLPWSPLKGGLLTGKFSRERPPPPETRVGWVTRDEMRTTASHPSLHSYTGGEHKLWDLLTTMQSIAQDHSKSIPQVALKWLLQKEVVSSVIIGAKTLAQLEDNMGAGTSWKLTDEQMELLDHVSMYDIPYPYEMIWRNNPKYRWQPKRQRVC